MTTATARTATLSLAIGMAWATWIAYGATATRGLFDSGPVGFTAAQAQRGQVAYMKSCASCHGRQLTDGQFGPPVKGAAFRAHWSNQSPEALRALIVQRMPPANPASLDSRTYTDIEAYLLKENGDPAGAVELASAASPAGTRTSSAARIDNRDAAYQAAMAAQRKLFDRMTPVSDEMLRNPPPGD